MHSVIRDDERNTPPPYIHMYPQMQSGAISSDEEVAFMVEDLLGHSRGGSAGIFI